MSDQTNTNPGVALVTGAAGIIGPTICDTLTNAGYTVAAHARNQASFDLHAQTAGSPVNAAKYVFADLTSADACRELVKQVEAELGPVRLLVNNAAYHPKRTALHEITPDLLEMMTQVNFFAPLYLTQAAAPSLADGGSVINLSSVMVEQTAPGTTLYVSLKAAVEKANNVLAVELGEQGTRVNTIRVGSVPGIAFMRDTIRELPREAADAMINDLLPKNRQARSNWSCLGRSGTPQDIADAIVFLASPQASFITGALLDVDGGLSKMPHIPENFSGWNAQKEVQAWLEKHGHAK